MENLNKKSLDDYPVTLRVIEVAEILRVNLTRAYELAKTESFPAFYCGNRIVVPKAAFERWMENQVNVSA